MLPIWARIGDNFGVVVVCLGGFDVCETELAARFGFDFGVRKNELPGDGFGLVYGL
jgi:hypothetical protein